jgi:hypothetical protein
MNRSHIWTIAICLLIITPVSFAGDRKQWPSKYAVVEMPVSLAMGNIRTPDFPVDGQWYDIIIQVEKPPSLTFQQEKCMFGTTSGPLDVKDCDRNDPLLQANWAVCEYDSEQCQSELPSQPQHGTLMQRTPGIVSRGSIPDNCACSFDAEHIYRQIGSFATQKNKKYIVEVRFTKDASALNVANPHLLVIRHKDFW